MLRPEASVSMQWFAVSTKGSGRRGVSTSVALHTKPDEPLTKLMRIIERLRSAIAASRPGSPVVQAVAERLRKNVFSVGNTVDPADAYRAFRGRDPKIDALMKKRGFTTKS